jgi:1-acyl-sn-glycerol-3-phosphate acyltransferase
MFSTLSKAILTLFGWTIEGNFPREDVPKNILAVVPHTSNWDFPLGILVRSSIKSDTRFLGKHTLFKFPYGWIFTMLGGYPVNRSINNNMVEAVASIFKSKEKFSITIAPEGTRKKVNRLRTGFYHIAKAAEVPIILTKFDWGHKRVHFSDPFYPTNDQEKDLAFINQYFSGIEGAVPENSFEWKEKTN